MSEEILWQKIFKLDRKNKELGIRVLQLEERLLAEAEQFKVIREYTKDGKLASICADHEIGCREIVEETNQ